MDAALPIVDAAIEEPARSHALHSSARTLIALAAQLHRTTPADPAATLDALAAAVAQFERSAASAGCDERTVAVASYVLCVWVDEVVADTPWGAGRPALLQRFHGERDGSDRVLRLLTRLAERPRENWALLELFHACLSLGLQGALRTRDDSAALLETLRSRVHLALQRLDKPTALAPAWRSHGGADHRWRWRRHALAGLFALGLLALGVYTASQLQLAARADAVFASLQQLVLASRTPVPPGGTSAPAVDRLASRLAADVAAGRLWVRDEAHRSVIALSADALFERGTAQLSAAQSPLLERVAAALKPVSGKVVITGYTDGADPRTARLPSAWHQSVEWAREVAQALDRHGLALERVSVEGAADADLRTEPSLPRRRIEIVLFP